MGADPPKAWQSRQAACAQGLPLISHIYLPTLLDGAGPNAGAALDGKAADGKQQTPPSSQSVMSFLESTIAQSQSLQMQQQQQGQVAVSSLSTSLLPDKQSSALGEQSVCGLLAFVKFWHARQARDNKHKPAAARL
jgi:hypothetical protein